MKHNKNSKNMKIPVFSSGTCGDSLKWVLNDNTLEIQGEGKMTDFTSPWHSFKDVIERVKIADGVTSVGEYAFYECVALREIELPESITKIGDYAFYSCDSLNSIELNDNITEIGATAFKDCGNLSVICRKGSYAAGYSSDKKVKVIYK